MSQGYIKEATCKFSDLYPPGSELSYCGQVPIDRLGTDKIGTDVMEVSSCSEVEGKEQGFQVLKKEKCFKVYIREQMLLAKCKVYRIM